MTRANSLRTVLASLLLTVGLAGAAGASAQSDAYFKWLRGLDKMNAQLGSSFGLLQYAIKTKNTVVTYNTLTQIGDCGRWLKQHANSPIPTINQDAAAWGKSLVGVESTGKALLAGRGTLKAFFKAEQKVSVVSRQFAKDVAKYNDQFRNK